MQLFLILFTLATAQTVPTNYDESKVGTYTLPDPLVLQDGTRVRTPADWTQKRRPEILNLFESNVYGRTVAGRPSAMSFELFDIDKNALGGIARNKMQAARGGRSGSRRPG